MRNWNSIRVRRFTSDAGASETGKQGEGRNLKKGMCKLTQTNDIPNGTDTFGIFRLQ
jgi:hypothetical protein